MAVVYQNGVDVSRYQGTVNWGAVAAAGKQFAIVRIGSSNTNGVYIDPAFQRNINGAKAAGLRVGAYYYSYATTRSAVAQELNTFLAVLQGLRLEYPVFMDVEAAVQQSLGRKALTALVVYAMQLIEQSGWYPGWYSYTNFANQYLDASRLSAYPCWIADYRGYVGYGGSYDLWQYSGSGSSGGITGTVDLDYSYKNFLPAITAANKNGYGTSGPAVEAVSDTVLEVFAERCEYFYSPNVNEVVGYLPLGTYPVLARTKGAYNGYVWVKFNYNGGQYWTALIADRNRLIAGGEGGCDECREQLAAALEKIAAAKAVLDS